jgi:hypothetical protein
MLKSRTMWVAPVGPESCPCQLEGARGMARCGGPGDTSYPGLTKIVASGTSTPGIGRNQDRGFVGRTVGRGQTPEIFGETPRSAGDHCDRDVDPVYLREGEGEAHRGKRSQWQKECC